MLLIAVLTYIFWSLNKNCLDFLEINLQKMIKIQRYYSNTLISNLVQGEKMAEQDEFINNQLQQLQEKIMQKVHDIRDILHEQDKAIVDEIVMKKSHSTDPIYPKYDKKVCYYQEFWKVYLLNEIMIAKIKDYSIQNKQLSKDVNELQQDEKQWTQLWTQKSKKKIRRTSDMIQKVYECPFDKCGRNYGSDVSLNLHMKLKHNSGTKTQREALAKQICLAQQKGAHIKIDLSFPPGYLEQFRQTFRRQNC